MFLPALTSGATIAGTSFLGVLTTGATWASTGFLVTVSDLLATTGAAFFPVGFTGRELLTCFSLAETAFPGFSGLVFFCSHR